MSGLVGGRVGGQTSECTYSPVPAYRHWNRQVTCGTALGFVSAERAHTDPSGAHPAWPSVCGETLSQSECENLHRN